MSSGQQLGLGGGELGVVEDPLCLELPELLELGDHVVLVAFGAGLTWASTLVRW